ncbi:MAG TPA: GNAT family N-acetyltransferase [Beijerinckiaceae bacterium]
MPDAVIRALTSDEAERRLPELAAILTDAVAGGASVNFLADFTPADAEAFWRRQLAGFAGGSQRLFAAEEGGRLVGTVILFFAQQPNQPHRGEIGKMLVLRDRRGRGIGRKLLTAAEDAAREAGKTLLVLDTAEGSAGERLYRACGWTAFGMVPGYSLTTDGRLENCVFFYKAIA